MLCLDVGMLGRGSVDDSRGAVWSRRAPTGEAEEALDGAAEVEAEEDEKEAEWGE